MPCNDGGQAEFYANREVHEQLERALARNDKLARLLCQACAQLSASELLGEVFEVNIWYSEHLEHDRKRVSKLINGLDVNKLGADQLDALEKVLDNL